jgi:hypothetical protein
MSLGVTRLDHRLGHSLEDGLLAGPAQRHIASQRPRGRLIAPQHGIEQVNDDQVGQPGDGEVGQLLRRLRDVQGGADVRAGLVQQHQPLACPVLLGDIEHADPDRPHPATGIPQRRDNDRPGMLVGLARHLAVGLAVRGFTGAEYLAHAALHRIVLRAGQGIGEAPSAQVGWVDPEHLAHAVVDRQAHQVLVMDRLGERRLGERQVHDEPVGPRIAVHLRSYRHPGDHSPTRCPPRRQVTLVPPVVVPLSPTAPWS